MYEYKAKVLEVTDGDTVVVNLDLGVETYRIITLRLENIDTPEIFRPKTELEKKVGNLIKLWLIQKIEGKDVIIKTTKDRREKYGRYLAKIYIEGEETSVNTQMILEGFDKSVALASDLIYNRLQASLSPQV